MQWRITMRIIGINMDELAVKMIDLAIKKPELFDDIKVNAYFIVLTPKPNQAYGQIEIATDKITIGKISELTRGATNGRD